MIRGSGCSKSKLGKAAGAEVAVQQRQEKWHAAVARSTFSSQDVQNTSVPEQFWKLLCQTMARGFGEKTHLQVKMYKTPQLRPLFKVQISKNGTPLWREAHLQIKMCMFGPLFEVEMWKNGTPTSQLFSYSVIQIVSELLSQWVS